MLTGTITLEETKLRTVKNIKRFDICSLLKLLKEMGYRPNDLYFESYYDLSSPTSICHEITFADDFPKVKIVLNVGLLAANSSLPNLFRKKMDSNSIDPILFQRFLSFFDHHTIKNLLSMSMPDVNEIFFSDWKETKGHYLKLLDLNSTTTLWHLFQACFPELVVNVTKAPRLFKQNSSSTMLGKTRLGIGSFLGRKIIQTIPSFKITLISEETHTESHTSWSQEIKERLKKMVFNILQRTHIHLKVIFILRNKKEIAHLSHDTQLGYCMLGESNQSLKMLLFSGYSKDLYSKSS